MERVRIRLGSLRSTVKPSSNVLSCMSVSTDPLITNVSRVRLCRVCTTCDARYTCPRCNTPYCSVDCYRTHGESCTEKFYESHVRSELIMESNGRRDDDKKQKKSIQELMGRVRMFQEEQEQLTDGDIDNDTEVMERMEELALLDRDGKLTLESLTPKERKRFLGEVADGRLGKLVGLWSPWWLMSEQKYRSETTARRRKLILEEIEDDGEYEEEDPMTVEPAVLYPAGLFSNSEVQNMPESINALLRGGRQPSPCLRYHLIEVLFAYALVLRTFNGDYGQDVAEAALMLLDLCQVLSVDSRYGSVEHACVACLEKHSSESPAAHRLAIQDTQKILQSDVFLLDALSDTRAILERYAHELDRSCESNKQARKERKTAMKKLVVVQKKLQFYTTWVYLTSIDEFRSIAAEIAAYMKDKELLGATG